MLEDTRQQFAKYAVTQAKKYLNEIEVAAKEAGVNCDIIYMVSDQPLK